MIGKFDSYRDSALHYLCSADWGNESFGDVNTYGVYLWRISNTEEDVSTLNEEFNSVMADWFVDNRERETTEQEVRDSLVGHFLVSENSQGLVTVKEFPTEGALIGMFNAMHRHFNEFLEESEGE